MKASRGILIFAIACLVVDSGAHAKPVPDGMTLVPAGTFVMGSHHSADTRPRRRASVKAFYFDTTEVTALAYAACVEQGACRKAVEVEGCNAGVAERGEHPINCVDWFQARSYCRWAGKRLPSEVEWEYAARGSRGGKYPWGNEPPASQLCWQGNTGPRSTCRVGSFPQGKSPFGLLDMAGNVWEWTANGFSPTYDQPRTSDQRVLRGGGWGDADPNYVSAVGRGREPPRTMSAMFGFRCALSASGG